MIEAAEAEGLIEPGRTTIVEATSGNTGIALAFVCAARGYDLVLTLPQGMSREREGLLRLYGAQVQVTESLGGMNEAVAPPRRSPATATRGCPTSSPTPPTRRRTAAPPAPRSGTTLDGQIDYLVAGVGTGGTITGAGAYLKERNPDLQVIAVEPRRPPSCPAACPARTRSRASAPASCRRCSTATCSTRSSRRRRGRDRDRPPRRPPRGRAGRHLLRRRAVARSRSPRAMRRAARGSSSSCRTRASATSRRRSSRPSPSARRPLEPAADVARGVLRGRVHTPPWLTPS